jgi:hypothetical protein
MMQSRNDPVAGLTGIAVQPVRHVGQAGAAGSGPLAWPSLAGRVAPIWRSRRWKPVWRGARAVFVSGRRSAWQRRHGGPGREIIGSGTNVAAQIAV